MYFTTKGQLYLNVKQLKIFNKRRISRVVRRGIKINGDQRPKIIYKKAFIDRQTRRKGLKLKKLHQIKMPLLYGIDTLRPF